MAAKKRNYHDQIIVDNDIKLREMLLELPKFCMNYFRGIEHTTSSRTRIAYAYDLGVFFNFIKENNPAFRNAEIRDFKLSLLEEITIEDIEEYMEYLKFYSKDDSEHTTLAFLIENKIAFTTTLDKGYHSFIQTLQEEYGLSDETAWRLLDNLFESREMDTQDVVIYIEQQDDKRIEITSRQLADAVLPKIRSWIADINAGCAKILESMPARYLITGQGANIPVLKNFCSGFNAPTSVYAISTIGARNGAFVCDLGMIYSWMDSKQYNNRGDQTSVNNNELEESIESITRYAKDAEGGFTRKLKKAMLANKE